MFSIETMMKCVLTRTNLDFCHQDEMMSEGISLDNTRLTFFIVVTAVILNLIVLFIVIVILAVISI
jgi:hypothetical protein